jgi:hypothetical protein
MVSLESTDVFMQGCEMYTCVYLWQVQTLSEQIYAYNHIDISFLQILQDLHTRVCTYVYVCAYVCMCSMHVHVHVHVHVHECVHVYTYDIHMYACIHIYMQTCI